MEKIILSFKIGRKGTPISRLDSGKIVFPKRGTTVEIDKYYIGEIVFEKDNFAIFRPYRMTRDIIRYKCGHEIIEGKGGEEIIREEDEVCPHCLREKEAKYGAIITQYPDIIQDYIRGGLKYFEGFEEAEKRIKIAERAKMLPQEVFDGIASLEYLGDYDHLVIHTSNEDILVELDDGFPIGLESLIYPFYTAYRTEFMDKLGFGEDVRSKFVSEVIHKASEAPKKERLKVICPVCGHEMEIVKHEVFDIEDWEEDLHRHVIKTVSVPIYGCPEHGEFVIGGICRGDHVENISSTIHKWEFDHFVIEMEESVDIYQFSEERINFHKYMGGRVFDMKRKLISITIDIPFCEIINFGVEYEKYITRKGEDKRITRLFKYKKSYFEEVRKLRDEWYDNPPIKSKELKMLWKKILGPYKKEEK